MKTCRVCKQEKPLEEFHKDKRSKDGHVSICKGCRKIYARKHYLEHLDQYEKYRKQYYQNNKEKILKQIEAYRKTPMGIEVIKKAQHKYWKSKKGKATRLKYQQSTKGKRMLNRKCRKHSQKWRAHTAVHRAIEKGILKPVQECQCSLADDNCEPRMEYHHYKGYKKECWLDVIPLCTFHHRLQHPKKNN